MFPIRIKTKYLNIAKFDRDSFDQNMSSIRVHRLTSLVLCGVLVLCVIPTAQSTTSRFTGLVKSPGIRGSISPHSNGTWEEICPHTVCLLVPHGHFVDNPMSGAAWFRCENGRASAGECPAGTWFNEEAQLCDHPWNVRCDAEQSEIIDLECVTEEEPEYLISCRGRDLHTVQHPFSCNEYYVCTGGIPLHRSCAPELEFNVQTGQCMEPERANCTFPECPPFNIPLTFVPSNTSCSEFAVCFDGEPIPHTCAAGLHWSQENSWCTFPEDADCNIDDSEEEGSSSTEQPPLPEEFECNDDSPIFNPNPNDCSSYYICDLEGIAHPQSCLEGLYFDIVTSQCTPRDSATCYSGSID